MHLDTIAIDLHALYNTIIVNNYNIMCIAQHAISSPPPHAPIMMSTNFVCKRV